MGDYQRVSCPEEHKDGASEWHTGGKLCDEWLQNLERGHFTEHRTGLIRRAVMRDQVNHFRRLDTGELIRLDVSLSQTHPEKRGFLKPESTEGGGWVSVLKRQEGAPLNLG